LGDTFPALFPLTMCTSQMGTGFGLHPDYSDFFIWIGSRV